MNYKALAIGVGLAALTGALQYMQVLPAPWGAIASAALVVLANFAPSPKGARK